MQSIQKLQAQKAALQDQLGAVEHSIARAEHAARQQAKEKIKALMQQHGLTADNLQRYAASPKYREPLTGQTWAGRGKQPNWLKAALKNGKKLEDFEL